MNMKYYNIVLYLNYQKIMLYLIDPFKIFFKIKTIIKSHFLMKKIY